MQKSFTYGVGAFVETKGKSTRVCYSNEFFQEYEQKRNHEMAQLRSDLDEEKIDVRYTCLYCGGEVRFRGGMEGHGKGLRRLHAFHIHGSKDCPYQDKKMPTKEIIKAIQFHGLQTGDTHETIKHKIWWHLENIYSASIEEEKRVYSIKHKYRQADLLATFLDKKLAIEIQISTLDLSTVNKRNKHYRDDLGIYIIWILDKFSPNLDMQSFTQQRILVTNEYNVFAYDDVAKAATENSSDNELYLHCYYSLFDHDGEEMNMMEDEVIPFSALHFRETDHMVYYKSKEDLIKEAEIKHQQEIAEAEKRRLERLLLERQEEDRKLQEAICFLNKIAQRKINNSTGKEYCIRDLNDKYNVLGQPNMYIKEALIEFIYEWVNSEVQNTSPLESIYSYDDCKNLIRHGIRYHWLDVNRLAEKRITPTLKEYIDDVSHYVIKQRELYGKEDLRRGRLELVCYIYSLLKLQQCQVEPEDFIIFDRGWHFISKLYSLFIGQIIGSNFSNFAGLTNEVSRPESYAFPYAHLYIQAYTYCTHSQRAYVFKNNKNAQYRLNVLKDKISSNWEANHDLDKIIEILFSISWQFE